MSVRARVCAHERCMWLISMCAFRRGDVCGKDNRFLKLTQGKHRLFQEGKGKPWQRECPTLAEYLQV